MDRLRKTTKGKIQTEEPFSELKKNLEPVTAYTVELLISH